MPRKQKPKDLTALEAAPLEAKPKRKRTPKEAAHVAEPLQELVEQIPGLSVGFPTAELPPPQPEIVTAPEREPVRTHTVDAPLAQEVVAEALVESQMSHVKAARANRPTFRPVPNDFMNRGGSFPAAGLKVNRSLDAGTVAIQFAEDRVPSREEKDRLEIDQFRYHEHHRQWERIDREQPAANLLDAGRIAQELSDARLKIQM